MLDFIKKEWQAKIAIIIFIVYSFIWLSLQFPQTLSIKNLNFYEISYGVLAFWGGICGLYVAKGWGFTKSVMGKAIIFLSLGLLAQVFGQVIYSYDVYIAKIEIPYPSIGDIGYFGSILFYIYGVYLLGKASGIKIGLKTLGNKIIAILIPISMLLFGYALFLWGHAIDFSDPLRVFLDFGYPLGQAIYISIALLTYLLSLGLLGGIMKKRILLLLIALIVQFIADYVFLYQVSRETWQLGGISGYIYLVAYFLMTLGILQLYTVVNNLKSKNS